MSMEKLQKEIENVVKLNKWFFLFKPTIWIVNIKMIEGIKTSN
jgi:hypothetical protein